MLSEQSLTDTDQQKATEKANQDGRQEIKRKNKNKKMSVQQIFSLCIIFLVCHLAVCPV